MTLYYNFKIRSLLFLLVLAFAFTGTFAQGKARSSAFWEQVRFGGAVGLGFGNEVVNVIVAPSAIYQFNDQFAAGTGLSFNYSKFGDSKLTAYGVGLMTYYSPIRELQLSAEYEQLRVNRNYSFFSPDLEEDYWLPVLFLGIGYNAGPVTFGIRYDILFNDRKSIYSDPWMPFVRVFF